MVNTGGISRPGGIQPPRPLQRTTSQTQIQRQAPTQQTPSLQRSATIKPQGATLQVQRHQEMTSPQQQEKLVDKLLNKPLEMPKEEPKLALMEKFAPETPVQEPQSETQAPAQTQEKTQEKTQTTASPSETDQPVQHKHKEEEQASVVKPEEPTVVVSKESEAEPASETEDQPQVSEEKPTEKSEETVSKPETTESVEPPQTEKTQEPKEQEPKEQRQQDQQEQDKERGGGNRQQQQQQGQQQQQQQQQQQPQQEQQNQSQNQSQSQSQSQSQPQEPMSDADTHSDTAQPQAISSVSSSSSSSSSPSSSPSSSVVPPSVQTPSSSSPPQGPSITQKLGKSNVVEAASTFSFRSSRYSEGAQKLRSQAAEKRKQATALHDQVMLHASKQRDPVWKGKLEQMKTQADTLRSEADGMETEATFLDKASEDLSLSNSSKVDTLKTIAPTAANLGVKIGMTLHNALADGGGFVKVVENTAHNTTQNVVYSASTLAQVTSVCGFVSAGTELYDGYKNCQKFATGWTRSEEAKALLMTVPEREAKITKLGTEVTSLQAKSVKLEQKLAGMDQVKHPKDTAKLKAEIKALAGQVQVNQAKIQALKKMNTQGVSEKSQAIAKQINERQGLGFKFMKILKNGLGVASGIVAGLVAIGLAATPVGWGLMAAGAVAAIGLLAYRAGKQMYRKSNIQELRGSTSNLGQQVQNMQAQVKGTRDVLATQRQELSRLQGKTDPASLRQVQMLTPRVQKLEARLQSELGELNTVETQFKQSQLALLSESPKDAISQLLSGLRQNDPESKYIVEHVMSISPAEKLLTMHHKDARELMMKHGLSLSPAN